MEKYNRKATASLVFGIISFVAWIIPLFGFPVSIMGLVMSFHGIKSENNSRGIAGLILSICGLVICVAYSAIIVYLETTGQLF